MEQTRIMTLILKAILMKLRKMGKCRKVGLLGENIRKQERRECLIGFIGKNRRTIKDSRPVLGEGKNKLKRKLTRE